MKRNLLFLFFLLFSYVVFSLEINFKLNKDVIVKGGNIDSPEMSLNNNSLVTFNDDCIYFVDAYIDSLDSNTGFTVKAFYKDIGLYFNADDLDFIGYTNFNINEKNSFWCMSYYYEALKMRNSKIILDNDFITKADRIETIMFQPLYFLIGNTYVGAQSSPYHGNYNAISRIEFMSDKEMIFDVLCRDCGFDEIEDEYKWEKCYYKLFKEETPYKIIFKLDGDYANIYLNYVSKENFLFTLVKTDKNCLYQISNLVKNNTCDLSRVTWPRHADGTCDYDDSSKSPKTAVSTKLTTPTASTNVTVNKTMSVTENLKLRSGEATTTQVLTVMSAGTKVKVLELGKAENIDGIDSNWVKVEVQKCAKDRDGKEIKEGTVGWCYGGYLKETANTSSEKKRRNN